MYTFSSQNNQRENNTSLSANNSYVYMYIIVMGSAYLA